MPHRADDRPRRHQADDASRRIPYSWRARSATRNPPHVGPSPRRRSSTLRPLPPQHVSSTDLLHLAPFRISRHEGLLTARVADGDRLLREDLAKGRRKVNVTLTIGHHLVQRLCQVFKGRAEQAQFRRPSHVERAVWSRHGIDDSPISSRRTKSAGCPLAVRLERSLTRRGVSGPPKLSGFESELVVDEVHTRRFQPPEVARWHKALEFLCTRPQCFPGL